MASIASSVAANTALLYLARNDEDQAKSIARITSGQRIVQASDDAAGLAVGTKLLSEVAVFKQAAANTTSSQAILSVTDGGLSAIGGLLERQAVLAAQSASGTVSDAERVAINTEFQALSDEINAIAGGTTFNGANLLDGTFNQNVLAGANAGDTLALDLSGISADTAGLGTAGFDLLSNGNATLALDAVNAAISQISGQRAEVGALQSRFGFRKDYIAEAELRTQEVASNILDVDLAEELSRLTNARVLKEASIAGLSQANQLTSSLLNLVR